MICDANTFANTFLHLMVTSEDLLRTATQRLQTIVRFTSQSQIFLKMADVMRQNMTQYRWNTNGAVPQFYSGVRSVKRGTSSTSKPFTVFDTHMAVQGAQRVFCMFLLVSGPFISIVLFSSKDTAKRVLLNINYDLLYVS